MSKKSEYEVFHRTLDLGFGDAAKPVYVGSAPSKDEAKRVAKEHSAKSDLPLNWYYWVKCESGGFDG